jgi:mono/diheme cytochrome c family protein
MQTRIVIGTIAFMLTMIILGFAALREPARLEGFTLAFEGRTIESGARLFQDSCATCHGVNGKAEECYDASGNTIGCQGLPLNNAALLCEDKSQRMIALGWEGTKQAFIEQTVASGRVGTVMPTWSATFGGPMREDQVQDVSAFVLNWESDAICGAPIVTFDWLDSVDDFLADFPDGDVANGEALYVAPYGCSACHGSADGSIPAAVGPDLSQIAETGGARIDGYSAAQYIYESILEPNAFIAEECPNGQPCISPSAMHGTNFPGRMAANPQDMADILTFLLQRE